METVETKVPGPAQVTTDRIIHLPLGLLGFERIKEYVLLSDPSEDPFLWLQARSDASLAFLVLPPQIAVPSYMPSISPEDGAFLGAGAEGDLTLLCIVTLRGAGKATINLKGPVVLNQRTWVAKQVIPVNASEFSVQHPLPVA